MSSRHLTYGSSMPPSPSILRLYSMKFCPYAQQVRLVLEAKRIPHEVININLSRKPDWYTSINPSGSVPCLHLPNGQIMNDSRVIREYLDNQYSENRLTPYDYNTQYEHQRIADGLSGLIRDLQSYNSYPSSSTARSIEYTLEEYLERNLYSDYIGGYKPAMVDYAIWPALERLEFYRYYKGLNLDSYRLRKTFDYIRRMKYSDAVRRTENRPDSYSRYLQGYGPDDYY